MQAVSGWNEGKKQELKERRKFFRDPIHRQITLNEDELKLVNTTLFQRLYDIKHLALGYKIFPSATHNRFSHSLGVMHLCDMMYRKAARSQDTDNDDLLKKIRVAGLLHDIGQGPFSHLAERISPGHISHEFASKSFVLQNSEIQEILSTSFSFSKEDIKEIAGMITNDKKIGEKHKRNYLIEILNGPLDADKIDYLQRDSHHTGVGFGRTEYLLLIDNLRAYKGSLVIEDGGIYAAETLMVSRMIMYKALYLNPVIRGMETAVVEAIKLIYEKGLVKDVSDYILGGITVPPGIPPLFAMTDTSLKIMIQDAKNDQNNKLSDEEESLLNFCYKTLYDLPIREDEEFIPIFEIKLEKIRDGILRKKLLSFSHEKKDFEIVEEVKKILDIQDKNYYKLVLVDSTTFKPYGIEPWKPEDEPIVMVGEESPRHLSDVSEIAMSLRSMPIEVLRIFIQKKVKSEEIENIKKNAIKNFGEPETWKGYGAYGQKEEGK